MTPIKLQPEFLSPKPDVYINKDDVSFMGIDGVERAPWLAEMDLTDLIKLLED